jgi:hypothetical protein
MTTDLNPNPAEEPSTYPPNPQKTPTKPGLPEKQDEGVDKVADRLAHKGAEAVQDFDKDNGRLISK